MGRHLSRRQFLGVAGAALSAPGLWSAPAQQRRRPRVAAIYTVFQHRSHAHVILEKFLRPYLFRGRRIEPPVDVVSFYADQIATTGDMSAEVAKQFKIPLFKTIADALCVG